MKDYIIYLVTYQGQRESAYTWSAFNFSEAERIKENLEKEYPDRVWEIYEKDVS